MEKQVITCRVGNKLRLGLWGLVFVRSVGNVNGGTTVCGYNGYEVSE